VVGDRVRWQATEDEGTIEQVLPRRNLFYRQDEIRTKSFAANLDHVLILIAAEPEFSEHQLARALIAAEAERITPIIALNKSDLVEPFERAWAKLAPYRRMHHGVLPLSLKASGEADYASLMKLLAGKSTLVLGPSGSGKSTLTNLLVPGAHRADPGDLAGAEFGQAHHHQHHLVLDRRSPHHRPDRLARLPGIRPEPHRADAARRADARHRRAHGRLQVLQLHPPARTGLRRDRERGHGSACPAPISASALQDLRRAVRRVEPEAVLSSSGSEQQRH
jgi:ribosome small subunit-dependent GTPase A